MEYRPILKIGQTGELTQSSSGALCNTVKSTGSAMDELFLYLDSVVQQTESNRVLLRTNSSNDKHVYSIRIAEREVSELTQVLSLLSARVESLSAEIIANDTSKELAKASLSTLTSRGVSSNLYSSGSSASSSLPLETLKLFFRSLQLMYFGHDERVIASGYDHLILARDETTSDVMWLQRDSFTQLYNRLNIQLQHVADADDV
jgi:hypothetical protein